MNTITTFVVIEYGFVIVCYPLFCKIKKYIMYSYFEFLRVRMKDSFVYNVEYNVYNRFILNQLSNLIS